MAMLRSEREDKFKRDMNAQAERAKFFGRDDARKAQAQAGLDKFRENQATLNLADKTHERGMELEVVKQTGFNKRTGMTEAGATERQGMAGRSNLEIQRSRNSGQLDVQFNKDMQQNQRLKRTQEAARATQERQIASELPAQALAEKKAAYDAGVVTDQWGATGYDPIRTKIFQSLGTNKPLEGGPGYVPQEIYDTINAAPVTPSAPAAAAPQQAQQVQKAPVSTPTTNPQAPTPGRSKALKSFRDFGKPGVFSVGESTNAALNSGSDFLKRYNERMRLLYRQK